MKSRIVILILLMVSINSFGQHLSWYEYDGQKYVAIDVKPVKEEFSNMKILLKGNCLEDLIYDMGNENKKVQKWVDVAKGNGVTDVDKPMKTQSSVNFVRWDYEGVGYIAQFGSKFSFMRSSSASDLEVHFHVNEKGECGLVYTCAMKDQSFITEISPAETSVETSVAGDTNGNTIGVAGITQKQKIKTKTMSCDFYFAIPAELVNNYINKLQSMFDQLKLEKKASKDAEKAKKEKAKIFK